MTTAKTGGEALHSKFLDPRVATARAIGSIAPIEPISDGVFEIALPDGQSEGAVDPLPDVQENFVHVIVPARIITISQVSPPSGNVWEFNITVTDALGDAIASTVSVLLEAYDDNGDIWTDADARFAIRAAGEGTMADADRPRVVCVTNSSGVANCKLTDQGAASITAHVVASILDESIAGNSPLYTVSF